MQERRVAGSRFGKTLYFTDREIDQMCVEALLTKGVLISPSLALF